MLPLETATDVNLPKTNNSVKGGLADPVLFFTYFFTADARTQRWLGFTNYFYLPVGDYDNTKALNVATPHQFTYVPEIGYTEGLDQFSPAMKGWFFDLVANASREIMGRRADRHRHDYGGGDARCRCVSIPDQG